MLIAFLFFLNQSLWAADGLNTLPAEYKAQQQSAIVLTNMPRVRSQDSIGICYAFSAATLLDEANCREKNVPDCSQVPDTEKASPLDIARYNRGLPNDVDNTDRFNYDGIKELGSSAFTLYNALRVGSVAKESCSPFDQVLSKVGTPAEISNMELAMWRRLQDSYKTYQDKAKSCAYCANEYATAVSNDLKKDFNLKAPQSEILKAFAEDTYNKFLDKFLIPDHCWDQNNQMSLKGKWKVDTFPAANKRSTYGETLNKAKSLLANKTPFTMTFCMETPLRARTMKECSSGHELIVTGYRKVCNTQGHCRDSLKVQNSWGEGWQRANDDGWVDAQELMNRTFYEQQALSWLKR